MNELTIAESFITIVALAMSITFIVLLGKVKDLEETVNSLNSTVNAYPFGKSLKERISENNDDILILKESINLILKGLPNLYKDDLDLVQKVDYPETTGRFITTSGVSVVVGFTGGENYPYAQSLAQVLRRAEEIRKVQEKCCPKKKGKK